MTASEKKALTKNLAEALHAARLIKDEAAMKAIRKEVKAHDLVWPVNQATSKLLAKHANKHSRDLRAATKSNDLEAIKVLIASNNEVFSFVRLESEALLSHLKNPADKKVY